MRRIAGVVIISLLVLGLTEVSGADHTSVIRALISSWREAWQRKDVDRITSFYSPDFKSERLDYQGLMARKARLFKKPGAISVKISGLEIKLNGKRAIARFVQRFKSPSYSDVGQKTLVLEKSDVKWVIISEAWRPFPEHARTTRRITAYSNKRDFDKKAHGVDKGDRDGTAKDWQPDKIIVKSIKFKVENNGAEKIFIGLNHFSIPKVLALEGVQPRIVIDFKNISSWKGHSRMPVNGQFIKQIRTSLNRETQILRIVLDLTNPSANYDVDPIFYKEENIYCLEVRDNSTDTIKDPGGLRDIPL